MAALVHDIHGRLPDERGYRGVEVQEVPSDHEFPTLWAVVAYNEIWNNVPSALWEYHAATEQEAEDVADWVAGIGAGHTAIFWREARRR
jgi:hypothetical protein